MNAPWNKYVDSLVVNCVTCFSNVKSLALGRFEGNFRKVIFKLIIVSDGWGISDECHWALLISQHWLKMAWCHRATSHYLSQSWPRFMLLHVSLGTNKLMHRTNDSLTLNWGYNEHDWRPKLQSLKERNNSLWLQFMSKNINSLCIILMMTHEYLPRDGTPHLPPP